MNAVRKHDRNGSLVDYPDVFFDIGNGLFANFTASVILILIREGE
jgi:hypothetical protein